MTPRLLTFNSTARSALLLHSLPQAETAIVHDAHYCVRVKFKRLQRICHGHQPLQLRYATGNVLRQQQRLLLYIILPLVSTAQCHRAVAHGGNDFNVCT